MNNQGLRGKRWIRFLLVTNLCDFDPISDLTIFNLVKAEFENYLLADLSPNASVSIAWTWFLSRWPSWPKWLGQSLSKVKWTTELEDGRVPSLSPSHDSKSKWMLGHWKSEEFSNFILVAPVVLREPVPQKPYESICIHCKNKIVVLANYLVTKIVWLSFLPPISKNVVLVKRFVGG